MRLLNAPVVAGLAMASVSALPAVAADIYQPPVYEAPPQIVYQDKSFGGWYIRGDIDYHKSKFAGADYITYGARLCDTGCGPVAIPEPGSNSFTSGELKGGFSLGGGVGYQMTQYLRTDVTADYWFKSDFTGSTTGFEGGEVVTSIDRAKLSALLLMANAYVDLGTYAGITPYVGAGIGGANLRWGTLHNQVGDRNDYHEGSKEWRFAYSLMAGASYCLTSNVDLDVGYRYTRINGGKMFSLYDVDGVSLGAGPGFDKSFNTHEVRAGLRYNFGGNQRKGCAPQEVAYQEPVFKPVYK